MGPEAGRTKKTGGGTLKYKVSNNLPRRNPTRVTATRTLNMEKAADVINVAELLVHLESKAENLARRIRVRKRCVKSSTIWRHHHLVAQ